MALLHSAILNGHMSSSGPNSPSIGDSAEIPLHGEPGHVSKYLGGFYTPDLKQNGLPLDMSMKAGRSVAVTPGSDDEGSINSKDEGKDETNPTSPATGSLDGDSSLSPESLEQLSSSQEPTIIVNGLDIYYKCKLCFKVFSTEQRWKRHKQDTHFNPRLHVCTVCGERFKRSTHLKRHQDRRHACVPAPATSDLKLSSPDKRRFSCSQCPRVFERGNKLFAHIQQYHQNKRPYRCVTCNEGFKRQDHLNRHRESKSHKLRLVLANKSEFGDDVINCGDVPKEMMRSFASHSSYRPPSLLSLVQNGDLHHQMLNQSERSSSIYPTNELHVQIDGQGSLMGSERETTPCRDDINQPSPASSVDDSVNTSGGKSLNSSNGSFDTASYMDMPEVAMDTSNLDLESESTGLMNKEGSVICSLCGKIFESEKRMKIHLRQTHSSERRHVCRLCGERFKRSTHLRRHLNSNKHQRLSQVKGHGKSDIDDLEHLTDTDYSLYNGKGRFPRGVYLNDYDEIPISMVPRSLPLQLYNSDNIDDDTKDPVTMETDHDDLIKPQAKNNPHFTDNFDKPKDFSTPITLAKPRGLISLLGNPKKEVNSDWPSLVGSAENGMKHWETHYGPNEHYPESTLRSLLQNSASQYNNNNTKSSEMSPITSGDDSGLVTSDSDLSPCILDMSHKYNVKPWECSICHHVFDRYQQAKEHVTDVHARQLVSCDCCQKFFKDDSDLQDHMSTVHDQKKTCDTPETVDAKETSRSVSRRKKTIPRKVLFHVETDMDGMEHSDQDDDLDPLTQFVKEEDQYSELADSQSNVDDESEGYVNESYLDSVAFVKKNTINNQTNFECRVCHKIFSTRPNLHTHIRQIHQNVRPFECQFCGETFKRGTHLRLHISRRHYEDLVNGSGSLDVENSIEHSPRLMYNKGRLNLHNSLLPNSAKVWRCTRCPKSFPKKDLYEHHLKLHLAAANCACPFCERSFSDEKSLLYHLRTHEDEPRFVCHLCNVSFILQAAYQSHIRDHQNGLFETPHGKGLDLSHELQAPSNVVSWKDKSDVAPIDKKQPVTKVTDSNIVKEVIVKLETLCAVCGEHFENMDSLRAHTRAHRKPYCCQYCNKKYDNISYLERHTRVHTGSKPYVCSVCNRGFPRKERAEEHIVKYH